MTSIRQLHVEADEALAEWAAIRREVGTGRGKNAALAAADRRWTDAWNQEVDNTKALREAALGYWHEQNTATYDRLIAAALACHATDTAQPVEAEIDCFCMYYE
jgi:hypothetical protein